MIVASYIEPNGYRERGIWQCGEKFFRNNLPKGSEIIVCLPLVVKGKTYAEKKANLHDLAVEWSYSECEVFGNDGHLSMGELIDVQNFFETNGKRYGLLEEFRENAIC